MDIRYVGHAQKYFQKEINYREFTRALNEEIQKRNIRDINNQLDDLYNNGLISEQTYFKEKLRIKEQENENINTK